VEVQDGLSRIIPVREKRPRLGRLGSNRRARRRTWSVRSGILSKALFFHLKSDARPIDSALHRSQIGGDQKTRSAPAVQSVALEEIF